MQHSVHDTTLIAGFAAGDLAGSELDRAQALVTTCTDCAALHRDLVAIAAATRALPNLARAPRDFRIDAEQAARLGRRSWLRGFLRPFASAGSSARPLATAFTSLGVAGLLVVTILPAVLSGLGGAAATTGGPRELAAGAPGPTNAPVAPAPGAGGGPTITPDRVESGSNQYGPAWSGKPTDTRDDAQPTDYDAVAIQGAEGSPKAATTDGKFGVESGSPPNPVFVGSLALIAVGLALFGLRFAGRLP
jgi:hypothetical protein